VRIESTVDAKERPVFIHIPKNGGMTVRLGYKNQIVEAGPGTHKSEDYARAVKAAMAKHGEHQGLEHARWRDLRPDLQARRCFAVVRNPWSRVVSRYRFGLNTGGYRPYDYTTFKEFLDERHTWGNEPYYWHRAVRGWYPMLDHVTDEQGVLRCDILRTEHLVEDSQAYMGKTLPTRRRNVTRGDPVDYRTFYNDDQIQIVAEWYAKDIEFFGFGFSGPATKNIWEGLDS
jgi:hypothetical protein